VLSVQAQLTTGEALPGWIQFDAQAGTFTVTPPPQAAGTTLEIRVTARDGEGREAAAVFKFNVGEGLREEDRLRQQGGSGAPANAPAAPIGPQGRSSFSDQIRSAAAQRGGVASLLLRAQADAIDIGRAAGGDRPGSERVSAADGLLQRLMASRAVQDRLAGAQRGTTETASRQAEPVDPALEAVSHGPLPSGLALPPLSASSVPATSRAAS
jgi:hypothetical protein